MMNLSPAPAIFSQRAWIDLRSASHAYALPFHTRQPKRVVYERLRRELADGRLIRRQLRRMPTPARAALDTLCDAGGRLPLADFTERFGTVRVWRAWRRHIPYRPWQRPQTAAEWLWHFGLVEFCGGEAVIPQEVANILPARPKPTVAPPDLTSSRVGTVLVGLAHLVGLLSTHAVRPMPGGWLPPRVWRWLGERINAPELCGLRHEKASPLARLIHYTAEAAGWLAVVDGHLRPTAQAWTGLALPPSQAADQLNAAVSGDVRLGLARWRRFGWPPIQRHHFAHAPWVLGLKHSDEFQPVFWPITSLQQTPCGEILAFALTPSPLVRAAAEGREGAGGEGFLSALAAVSGLGRWENGTLWFDRDTLRAALASGGSVESLADSLSTLTGQPLPFTIRASLTQWAQQAVRLRVEHVALLTAADPADLDRLRADWRLRRWLGTRLSPNHTLISAAHLPDLLAALNRRDLAPLVAPTTQRPPSLDQTLAEYAYLGVRVSQRVGRWLPSGALTLPGFVRHALAERVGRPRADQLDQQADHALAVLHQRLRRLRWLDAQDGE